LKTFIPRITDIRREWVLVDADGERLGRLATRVATYLRGKHRPIFTPNLDTGDFVIVVNADKIALTGRKMQQKTYFRHSTHPGGGTTTPVYRMMNEKPELVIRKAVWGMLPHNPLGRKLIRKLKIYAGPGHPHEAQQPRTLPGGFATRPSSQG
jgi:large subunit ribosomal protein L13